MNALLLTLVLGASDSDPDPLARGHALAEAGRWQEAAQVLGPAIDASHASASEMALLVRVVLESGDLRRASLLSEQAVLRFPDDPVLRKLDLAVLLARGAWDEADTAARGMLAHWPEDPVVWRQLARAKLESADEQAQRIALEAAHLAQPDDPVVFEQHLRAQLRAAHVETAAELAAWARGRIEATPSLALLAARAAEAGARLELAAAWAEAIPAADRGRAFSLLEARIALARGDEAGAAAALERLIERGEADPAILHRAGRFAEQRGDTARAEALYARAAEGEGPPAKLAELSLARLWLRLGQRERAIGRLEAYLHADPADIYARQLLKWARGDR